MSDTKYLRTVPIHPPTRGATLGELLTYWDYSDNPVTRSVFRNMVAARLEAMARGAEIVRGAGRGGR